MLEEGMGRNATSHCHLKPLSPLFVSFAYHSYFSAVKGGSVTTGRLLVRYGSEGQGWAHELLGSGHTARAEQEGKMQRKNKAEERRRRRREEETEAEGSS